MSDADQLDLLQVTLGARYKVERALGSGGMATVYLAEDLKHQRHLAIKVLHPDLAAMLGRERFLREIAIAARLNHPHILGLIDSGESGSLLYYVMPLVEGDSLRRRLDVARQVPIDEAVRLTIQVASALEYAHRLGIVHRDIKPENILLHQGEALIADFGIALALQSAGDTRLTATRFGLGTPAYMSPEQATGDREIDARSDLYSLACVLYEMLVGEPPYTGPTAQAILAKCLMDPIPEVRRFRDAVPVSIDRALRRALAKSPVDRFASSAEFIAALNESDESARAHRTLFTDRTDEIRAPRTNLPLQSTALIGRQRELAEVTALLDSHRLVTLTGPGGSGKTRLALQVAAQALGRFPDGVFWVPLQALRDPALVAHAIATAVGAGDQITEHMAEKRLLIVLDNFEQLVAAAPTVSAVIAGTRYTRWLVTSREPLHVEAEQRYAVDPLPNEDATALFMERAQAVSPDVRLSEVVPEICRRLDGLPLAIELAAARVALLDPCELLKRLDRRLPLLASRSRDAPPRQRTLRAAIEWSFELLTPDEQEFFAQLAVFRGTFSIEAAEVVCGADLAVLESLVVKNLLRRWDSGRLGMLDTIREYAGERLEASRFAADVHRRHAEFFLAVAEKSNLSAGTATSGFNLGVAVAEQDNFRAALAWALSAKAIALGLELATAIEMFWVTHDPREGVRWFKTLLERPEAQDLPLAMRAHALRAYGSATDIAGDDQAAESLYQESLGLFEQLGDEYRRAQLLHRLGIQAMRRRDLGHARQLVDTSHAIFASEPNEWLRTWGLLQTSGTLGAIARDAGDNRVANEMFTWSAALAAQAGVRWWEAGVLAELAALALNDGRTEDGHKFARQALVIADQLRDRAGRVFGVGLMTRVAVERGRSELAGRLWGALEHEDAVAPLGGWRRHRTTFAERIRTVAGPEFERGYAVGRGLTLDEVVTLALE